MRRYYALMLASGNRVQLLRVRGERTVLAETRLDWTFWEPIELSLEAVGMRLRASVNGREVFDVVDDDHLTGGAVAIVCEEGTISAGPVSIAPAG
ncbi:MAG: hypothetical protein R3A46_03450 [Thermomicrobiales bacterium]